MNIAFCSSRKRWKKAAGIIALSSLLLAACQQPVTYTPAIGEDELAMEKVQQEQEIAEAKAMGGRPKAWRQSKISRSKFEKIAGRVEEAGAKVCQEMGLPAKGRSCYYYFGIDRDRDINAYADGEAVVVSSGMMRFIENDDELAMVLGHELAHNLMAHHRAKGMNSLVGGLLGFAADAAMAYGGGVNTQGGFTKTGLETGGLIYSIPFEQEADYVGSYIAARGGFNVGRGAQFWRRMSQHEPESASGGATHPSNAERFVMLQKTVDEINYKRKHRVALLPDLKKELTNSW